MDLVELSDVSGLGVNLRRSGHRVLPYYFQKSGTGVVEHDTDCRGFVVKVLFVFWSTSRVGHARIWQARQREVARETDKKEEKEKEKKEKKKKEKLPELTDLTLGSQEALQTSHGKPEHAKTSTRSWELFCHLLKYFI